MLTILMSLVLVGCSGGPAPQTAAMARAQPATETAEATEIRSMAITEIEGGLRLEVAASDTVVWTSYRDDEGNLVVVLNNSLPSDDLAAITSDSGLLESVRIEAETTGARPLTRLLVATRGPAEHSLTSEGPILRLELLAQAGGQMMADAQPEMGTAEMGEVEEMSIPDSASTGSYVASGTLDKPYTSPAPSGVAATSLQWVSVEAENGGSIVRIVGDGEFQYRTFRLQDPERFVVDLEGVANMSPASTIPGMDLVERVRVAQFQSHPDLVARVVVDLVDGAVPALRPASDGLSLVFGSGGSGEMLSAAPSMGSETLAESVADATYDEPIYDTEPAEEMAVDNWDVDTGDSTWAEAEAEPVEVERISTYEAAEVPSNVASQTSSAESEGFGARAIGSGAKIFRGEPIFMSLKDADIKDVLRSFAEISGLNVVVDPTVSGTVTVELNNVPWDQALDQVLKINTLDYVLEGNIMRVAPVSKLADEAKAQQALKEAQALSLPLSTIIQRVSYADASSLAGLLSAQGGVLSQRGSVSVDDRTNTLIIKELPEYIDTVIALIENLDIPEPQVMIEARIVETTKRFTRSLGVEWGFTGLADAAHGNTTGLIFPNNIDASGGVNLVTGGSNATLGLTLGNVLNTFQLDIALQAAESEGLINILSAPRIATLNNQTATIQSGLQIPVQTVSNNTVSVQFVNATLALTVRPHVTAEGTVLMDIVIQKREPQLAFAIAGAANAPIATKEASTRVIVRDGGTTVIGGIYEVSTDHGEDRVPGLGKVPILKHLFKNKRQNDENEELLIFITPRVMNL